MSDQPSLRLSDIRKGRRYRIDLGDIDALAASIRASGLLHPVVVTSDSMLVAGERRLAAVAALGWTRVPVRVIDPVDLLTAERDENAVRKDFTPSEAVAIAAAIRPVEQELARERQAHGQTAPGRNAPEQVSEASAPMAAGTSRERVAAAVGMSFETLRRAQTVVDAAEAGLIPRSVVEQMDATGKVAPAYQTARAAGFARPPRPGRRINHREAGRLPARPTKRPHPGWWGHFTRWVRRPLAEERAFLVEMRDAAQGALDLLDEERSQ